MRNRRKIRYRITAAALISSILGMSMAGSVLAGPPRWLRMRLCM